MIGGILFLLCCIFICLVVFWDAQNRDVPLHGKTVGFYAMKNQAADNAGPDKRGRKKHRRPRY